MEVLEVLDVEIFSIICYIQPLKLPNENDSFFKIPLEEFRIISF